MFWLYSQEEWCSRVHVMYAGRIVVDFHTWENLFFCLLQSSLHGLTNYRVPPLPTPPAPMSFFPATLACVAGAWKWWEQEKTGVREGDTRGERKRLHGRPPKIVSRPLSNYLAAVAWSVKSFDRKRLTSHKQSKPPKNVVHFIFGLNIYVIKISWVIWL